MRDVLLRSVALLGLAGVFLGGACGCQRNPAPAGGTGGDRGAASDAAVPAGQFRVLLFSRTAGFRHDSIPSAIQALTDAQVGGGYLAEATEDPAQFNVDNLRRFRVVVFLLTTGDVLNDAQQDELEAWIGEGGGYVGVHAAADTEYDWPFYGQLVGAYFSQHPAVQLATVHTEIADHPVTVNLPAAWTRADEWYDFRSNPRPGVTVLATVDETTYSGGMMGSDHPIAWAHSTSGGGRAVYTAMGHTIESYRDQVFVDHLVRAIRWAARP